MKRLTYKAQSNCGFIWAIRTLPYSNQDVIDRLAAYEDTGLEPEEVVALITPPNPPLTLEELREMDGEPVYIMRINDSHIEGGWALVHREWCGCKTASGCVAFFERYGEFWLAYRRKPEEGYRGHG